MTQITEITDEKKTDKKEEVVIEDEDPNASGKLSEMEMDINKKINGGDVETAKSLISAYGKQPNFTDDMGMSPLLHAAYKGQANMCSMLLDMGSDVNQNTHIHNYSALHFAALSGNVETCRVLLSAGANSTSENSVKRSPAQMAAFVGNHGCVTVINNWLPFTDIEYYTIKDGLETEAKLTTNLTQPIHKYLTQVNLHPVSLLLHIQSSHVLIDKSAVVCNVLNLLCEKYMKQSDTNEVLAIKVHYLSFLLKHVSKEALTNKDKTKDILDVLMKVCLRNNEEYLDALVRESIKCFPYSQSGLFQQIIRSLTGCMPGTELPDTPIAWNVLQGFINGQRGFSDPMCGACGADKPSMKCISCRAQGYCNRICQKLHWFVHKKECKEMGKKEKLRLEMEAKEEAAKEAAKSEADKLSVNKLNVSSEAASAAKSSGDS